MKIFFVTTKLILSVGEEKVKKIKRISIKKSGSVSNLSKDFIDDIGKKEKKEDFDINKIIGAFGKAPKNFDWKKERTKYLMEKYKISNNNNFK